MRFTRWVTGLLLCATAAVVGCTPIVPTESTTTTSATPPPDDVAAGTNHSCGLTDAGGVKCWGSNGLGELGDGTTDDSTTPVDVVGLGSGVVAVATGVGHSCALTTGGGVKCWGWNAAGQLGNGTTDDTTTPVDVVGLGSGVTAISATYSHTCAATDAGAVKCWGWNTYGQLGDGTDVDATTPVDVSGLGGGVTAVSAGTVHTCALTATGGVKCWGYNDFAVLGDGTTTSSAVPVDVVGLGAGVTAVSTGQTHSCALQLTGGVKCWGSNAFGELGDGTTELRASPVDVVGRGSGTIAVTTGANHSCAIVAGGTVDCWGSNDYGQLGDGTVTTSPLPVHVVGLAGASDPSAGTAHTCVVVPTGLQCWGSNERGQLGDGTTDDSPTPVTVIDLG